MLWVKIPEAHAHLSFTAIGFSNNTKCLCFNVRLLNDGLRKLNFVPEAKEQLHYFNTIIHKLLSDLLIISRRRSEAGGAAERFSFHTNLQTALDKVEGHHCCVREAATQDPPKATQSIVLRGAELAADGLCGRRGATKTCSMQGHMQHRTRINTRGK